MSGFIVYYPWHNQNILVLDTPLCLTSHHAVVVYHVERMRTLSMFYLETSKCLFVYTELPMTQSEHPGCGHTVVFNIASRGRGLSCWNDENAEYVSSRDVKVSVYIMNLPMTQSEHPSCRHTVVFSIASRGRGLFSFNDHQVEVFPNCVFWMQPSTSAGLLPRVVVTWYIEMSKRISRQHPPPCIQTLL